MKRAVSKERDEYPSCPHDCPHLEENGGECDHYECRLEEDKYDAAMARADEAREYQEDMKWR